MKNVQKKLQSKIVRTLSCEYDCLVKISIKEAFTSLLENYIKRQCVPTQTDNQRQKYMKNTHLLLRILAVIGRYGII